QTHYERAFSLLASRGAADAFDLSREPQAVRERYGMNIHGQAVLQARRLVEAGVPLVTVFWQNDGITNVSVYLVYAALRFIFPVGFRQRQNGPFQHPRWPPTASRRQLLLGPGGPKRAFHFDAQANEQAAQRRWLNIYGSGLGAW